MVIMHPKTQEDMQPTQKDRLSLIGKEKLSLSSQHNRATPMKLSFPSFRSTPATLPRCVLTKIGVRRQLFNRSHISLETHADLAFRKVVPINVKPRSSRKASKARGKKKKKRRQHVVLHHYGLDFGGIHP